MNTQIQKYGIRPADRIIVPKSILNIVQHHVIYLGYDDYGTDWIIENKIGFGVRCITANQFFHESSISEIIRFTGNDYARNLAVKRALSLVGKPYDLITFNCEHFANYVQKSETHSNQVVLAGLGVLMGCVLFLNSK